MDYEIHMYMAVARAETATLYPEGEWHPMLVLLRQPSGSEHDLAAAAAVAMAKGWVEVDVTRAGILPPDAAERPDEPFRSCHADAVRDGEALMVYSAVVQPAPPKGSAAVASLPPARNH